MKLSSMHMLFTVLLAAAAPLSTLAQEEGGQQVRTCENTDVALTTCTKEKCAACSRQEEQEESLTAASFECGNIKKDLARAVCPTLECCPACRQEVLDSLVCGSQALEGIMKSLGDTTCDLSQLDCPNGSTVVTAAKSASSTLNTAKSVSAMSIAVGGALLMN